MELLPSSTSEFTKEKYWDDFFVKLESKPFEWYSDYESLKGILSKYIRVKDKLLILGCGNSSLSSDLYNAGFGSIINIDISATVIDQMKEKYSESCPDMVFAKMDLFQMEFENEEFSVVIDKGTLDSIMVDGSQKVSESIDHAFAEIARVLKFGGRYICVSLLQEHILRKILSWFFSEEWLIRIYRCFDAEKKYTSQSVNFPVFVVVCAKLKKVPGSSPILELVIDEQIPKRMCDIEDVIQCISSMQRLAFLKHQLSERKIPEEHVALELCCSKTGKVKYKLFVVDSIRKCQTRFAVFIVPQGRETEWMFASNEGRKELIRNASCGRLIVVHLQRDFTYNSLDEIKEDLSANVMELAPGSIDSKIPFLSLGEDVGWREIKAYGSSEFSGQYVVEDVMGDDKTRYRRLIFLGSPFMIQSEARLKEVKDGEGGCYEIDFDYLACSHHSVMISGLALLESNVNTSPEILLIGLGGGGLAMYILRHLTAAKMNVVELDPDIVSVSKEWFGVESNENLIVTVSDGIAFMKDAVEKGVTYNAVMIDVDNKDQSLGMSCPPAAFVENEMLSVMSKLIGETGVFILNLVCRNSELREDIVSRLKSGFMTVFHRKISNEVNDIFYCINSPLKQTSKKLKHQARDLQKHLSRQTFSDDDSFDVTEIISALESIK